MNSATNLNEVQALVTSSLLPKAIQYRECVLFKKLSYNAKPISFPTHYMIGLKSVNKSVTR